MRTGSARKPRLDDQVVYLKPVSWGDDHIYSPWLAIRSPSLQYTPSPTRSARLRTPAPVLRQCRAIPSKQHCDQRKDKSARCRPKGATQRSQVTVESWFVWRICVNLWSSFTLRNKIPHDELSDNRLIRVKCSHDR